MSRPTGQMKPSFSFTTRARAALSVASSYATSAAGQAAGQISALSTSTNNQSWEDWFQDIRNRRKVPIPGIDDIYLMPGWAVGRPRQGVGGLTNGKPTYTWTNVIELTFTGPFDVFLSTTGFCAHTREPHLASRTQRAVIALVKREWPFSNDAS